MSFIYLLKIFIKISLKGSINSCPLKFKISTNITKSISKFWSWKLDRKLSTLGKSTINLLITQLRYFILCTFIKHMMCIPILVNFSIIWQRLTTIRSSSLASLSYIVEKLQSTKHWKGSSTSSLHVGNSSSTNSSTSSTWDGFSIWV